MSIRIILADDHQMVREGLRLILSKTPEIEVVGEATSGRATVELASRLVPDVVVMDIGMPDLNGIEATRQIKAAQPGIQVIGLSAFSERQYVVGMLAAGSSGYVQKSAAGEELVRAIEAVNRGMKFLSPEIAHMVVESYVNHVCPSARSASSGLGSREKDVLQLLAQGSTTKQVAVTLHLSSRTVETHRRNIMRKLNLHNIAELTKYAIREGIITTDE